MTFQYQSGPNSPRRNGIFGGEQAEGKPIVTYAIIGICVVVWLLQLANDRVFQEFAFSAPLAESDPWRFLTSAFLHSEASPLHLGFNMLTLYMVGPYLESLLGRARYLALYLLSGIGGSVGYLLLSNPESTDWLVPVVGASGAVFGLFLALIILNAKLDLPINQMVAVVGINAALPIVTGASNIAWEAHLGGAVVGAIVAGLIVLLGRDRASLHWAAFAVILALLAGGSYAKTRDTFQCADASYSQCTIDGEPITR